LTERQHGEIIGIGIRGQFVRAVLLGTSYRASRSSRSPGSIAVSSPELQQAVQACLLPCTGIPTLAVAIDGESRSSIV
jgi:hypothetical protein